MYFVSNFIYKVCGQLAKMTSAEPAISSNTRSICHSTHEKHLGCRSGESKDFLFCFDVDGVFLRGKYPIKKSKGALKLLKDNDVDYIFLTNNCSRSETDFTAHLSDLMQHPIDSKLMFMAQTPFRMHKELHAQRMLVVGYRNEYSVLESAGFTNLVTVKDFCSSFEDSEEESQILSKEKTIQPIDGVVILEEPIGWELSVQTILDLIVTGGDVTLLQKYTLEECLSLNFKPIPIYASCTDYLTKSESPWPRLSIGAFLYFLEEAHEKLLGRSLQYERVYGKPNDETYVYLRRYIKEIYGKDYKRMYFVGDNLLTDIYGANLHRAGFSSENNAEPEIKTCFVHTGVHAKNWQSDPSHVTKVLSLLHRNSREKSEKYLYPDIEADNVTSLISAVLSLEGL